MNIEIYARGIDMTGDTRSHIERRLYFALGRFSGRVKRVHVRLADENGPRGGVDKRCTIEVRLSGLREVIVKQASTDLYSAIDLAVERTGRTVARRINRELSAKTNGYLDEKER